MARGYEDLSRRGLIALNHDFDADNGGQLMNYLQENDEKYEGTRFVEKVTVKVDQIVDSFKSPGGPVKEAVKDIAIKSANKVVDVAIDVVKTVVVGM